MSSCKILAFFIKSFRDIRRPLPCLSWNHSRTNSYSFLLKGFLPPYLQGFLWLLFVLLFSTVFSCHSQFFLNFFLCFYFHFYLHFWKKQEKTIRKLLLLCLENVKFDFRSCQIYSCYQRTEGCNEKINILNLNWVLMILNWFWWSILK